MSARPIVWAAGVALALAVVGFGFYRWTLSLPLLGWDAYPLIAASRFDSLGAFFGTFTEELMDGRYTDGRFHRPLTHLTFGLDEALYGLRPLGYRVTDLLLAIGAACAVGSVAWGFAARRCSRSAPCAAAALSAGLVYLLHPAQLEVLPFAPRRADTLAVLWLCATVVLHRRARPGIVALAAFCAAAAKETGYLVLPLVAAHVALSRGHWRHLVPVGLGVGAVGVLRVIAIGGFGGHAESGVAATDSVATVAAELARGLTGGAAPSSALLCALPFVAALVLLARDDRRAALWIAVSALCAVLLTLAAGRAHGWYVALLTLPVAWVAGLAVARAIEHRGSLARAVAVGCLAALAAATAVTRSAPREPGLARATALARAAVAELTEAAPAVRAQGAGETRVATWTFGVPWRGGFVFVHAPYSLAALAECLAPELLPELATPRTTAPPAPGRWRLVLSEPIP